MDETDPTWTWRLDEEERHSFLFALKDQVLTLTRVGNDPTETREDPVACLRMIELSRELQSIHDKFDSIAPGSSDGR